MVAHAWANGGREKEALDLAREVAADTEDEEIRKKAQEFLTARDPAPASAAEAEAPQATEATGGSNMKHKLSRRLSPAAKKAFLLSTPEAPVRALVEVAAPESVAELKARFEERGASLARWTEGTRLLTLEAPAGLLSDLAELEGVLYIDVATEYRPGEEPVLEETAGEAPEGQDPHSD